MEVFMISDLVCATVRTTAPVHELKKLTGNTTAQAFAREHGLSIQKVSWEDTARDKKSCWGPNISDMTLLVTDSSGKDVRMPVIRQPNFTDKTHDVAIGEFSAFTGNEIGEEEITEIPLMDYLKDPSDFFNNGNVKGSLLCERDAKVIHNVQACFLPAGKAEEVKFNVALFNYQSYEGHPAVLTLVNSCKGTSAQIIDEANGYDGQKLYYNKNGNRCSFIAERLKDVRAAEGKTIEGEMSKTESMNRKLQIVQIPLKVKERPMRMYAKSMGYGLECCAMSCSAMGIDDAQIKIGEEEGEFRGLGGVTIERDERFPIRVTTQLYKISDTAEIGRKQMEHIAAEIKAEEAIGEDGSSLVIEDTDRPTEWIKG